MRVLLATHVNFSAVVYGRTIWQERRLYVQGAVHQPFHVRVLYPEQIWTGGGYVAMSCPRLTNAELLCLLVLASRPLVLLLVCMYYTVT